MTTLHLLRATVPIALAQTDWVVYLNHLQLEPHGQPPIASGRIDHDQLVVLITRADRVITW